MAKIDISSTALEKGIDLAKEFLGKLIGPTVEEAGLLMKDQISLFRFNNQVKILKKAQAKCEKNNITTKAISLKLLCPLLDFAALEDDDDMQDKWANLLTNMVDSEQNFENHVFPYLLSQISKSEYHFLDESCSFTIHENSKADFKFEFSAKEHRATIFKLEKDNEQLVNDIHAENDWNKRSILNRVLRSNQDEIQNLRETLRFIQYHKHSLVPVPTSALDGFEIQNVMRLGLLKSETYSSAELTRVRIIGQELGSSTPRQGLNLKYLDDYHYVTELGLRFFEACSERKAGGDISGG